MTAMESPLQCFTNQPNSSQISNIGDTLFISDTNLINQPKIIKSEDNFDVNSSNTLNSASFPKTEAVPVKKEAGVEFYDHSLGDISTVNINDLKQEPLFRTEEPVENDVINLSLSKAKGQSGNAKKVNSKVPAAAKAKFRNLGTSKKSGTRSRDPAAKKHKCQFCDKSFACGYSLTRHVRIHTGEQCYPCDVCNKVFTTRSSKIRHDRTHLTEGTYKCEFCNLVFKRPFLLTEHQVVHTGEKPFSCGLCGKAFSKELQLASHLKTHVQDKYADAELPPVETCELCNQGFPDNEFLLEHLKEHVADAEEQALQSDQIDSSSNVELDSAAILSAPVVDPAAVTTAAATAPVSFTPQVAAVTSPATPVQFPPQLAVESNSSVNIKPEPQHLDNTSYFGPTIVDNKLLADAQIELQSNIVYVVGEDGTLQPQLLTNTQFATQQTSAFSAAAVAEQQQHNSASASTSVAAGEIATSILENTPDLVHVIAPPDIPAPHPAAANVSTLPQQEPIAHERSSSVGLLNTEQSITPQVSISVSDVSVTVSDVVAGVSAAVNELVSTNNSSIVNHLQHQSLVFAPPEATLPLGDNSTPIIPHSAESPVIAQADTTSVGSLRTDDEDDDSLAAGPIDGQDILALACKEILIVPESDTASADAAAAQAALVGVDTGFLDTSQVSNSSGGGAGSSNMLTAEKEKKFHCEYCDKSFTQSNNLDSHRRTHTKEKPFRCTHCDMCFSQRWSLTRHVRIHTGEKPFKCGFCSASFRIKGEKTEHEKTMHLMERNERMHNQSIVRSKSFPNGPETSFARSLSDSPNQQQQQQSDVLMEHAHSPYATAASPSNGNVMSNIPKIEFNTTTSHAGASGGGGGGTESMSSFVPSTMSQTDDSDSRSDYESVQSSQFGDGDAAGKFSVDIAGGSQDNGATQLTGNGGGAGGSDEADIIKFHYGAEEFMDGGSGSGSPVLTTLGPAEFIMEPQKASLTYHCDFCESSFATRSELVYHFSMHTEGS